MTASDEDDQGIEASKIVGLLGRVSGGTGLADAVTSSHIWDSCVTKAIVKHFNMMAQVLANKSFLTVTQEKCFVSVVM